MNSDRVKRISLVMLMVLTLSLIAAVSDECAEVENETLYRNYTQDCKSLYINGEWVGSVCK